MRALVVSLLTLALGACSGSSEPSSDETDPCARLDAANPASFLDGSRCPESWSAAGLSCDLEIGDCSTNDLHWAGRPMQRWIDICLYAGDGLVAMYATRPDTDETYCVARASGTVVANPLCGG